MDRTDHDQERRLNLLIVALTLAAVVAIPFLVINADPLGALLGGGSSSGIVCGDFAFDRAAWQKRGASRLVRSRRTDW